GQLPAAREEADAQDVGVAQVGALGAEGPPGSDREAAAAILVEDGGEQRGAVEPRPAEPVERAATGDQGRRPAVADDGIVLDGRGHAETRSRLPATRVSTTDSSNQRACASRPRVSSSCRQVPARTAAQNAFWMLHRSKCMPRRMASVTSSA